MLSSSFSQISKISKGVRAESSVRAGATARRILTLSLSTDLSPEEVTNALQLHKLNRLWFVQPSVATEGSGIFEGLVSFCYIRWRASRFSDKHVFRPGSRTMSKPSLRNEQRTWPPISSRISSVLRRHPVRSCIICSSLPVDLLWLFSILRSRFLTTARRSSLSDSPVFWSHLHRLQQAVISFVIFHDIPIAFPSGLFTNLILILHIIYSRLIAFRLRMDR